MTDAVVPLSALIGYFDNYRQTVPAYDPGTDIPCLVDGAPLRERPRVTVSLISQDDSRAQAGRSYFFRAHKDCWEGLSTDEQSAYESSVIDGVNPRAQTIHELGGYNRWSDGSVR